MNKEEMKKLYSLDDDIVDLVYQFNRLGLKTLYSCGGHDWYKKPYIMFDSEEENIHNILGALYKKYSKNNTYLDIGDFLKLCRPMIVENYDFDINNHWLWEARYWDVKDYKTKIDNFVSYLSKL